jgi:hypothetical protein
VGRVCIFCEGQPCTREHVLPKWLAEIFDGHLVGNAELVIRGVGKRNIIGKRLDLHVRSVCATCNNGWLSDLESDVRLIVLPLLSRGDCELSAAAQATLAKWAACKAMIVSRIPRRQTPHFWDAELSMMQLKRRMPDHVVAWLAYSPSNPRVGIYLTEFSQPVGMPGAEALGMTLQIGSLLCQVYSMRRPSQFATATVTTDVTDGSWNDASVQIWPCERGRQQWPPKLVLANEEQCEAFAERFSVQQALEKQRRRIAV